MTQNGIDRSGAAGGTGASVTPLDENIIDAKGDLIVGTADDTAARKAVGANDTMLMADSAEVTGVKWATPEQVGTAVVGGQTALTAPAVGDQILVLDVSETPDVARKMTLEDTLEVVNGLTEDTTPDTDDFLLSYDVSASAAKKVKPENLPVAARKNAIINGGFDIFQRGTSYASISNAQYLADRWRYNLSGTTAVHAASRSTDVPSVALAGRLFNYSHLLDCTTADGTLAASDFITLEQRIEGYNWLPLAQRACTLSFLVKATKTGTYCVSFRNTGNDQCYIAEYTVSVSDTWEKKTIQLPASPSSGTWDYTNGEGLKLAFVLAAGTDHHGTAGAWSGSNKIATANQVNAVDNVANNFRITGAQLEVGSVATDFEYRTIQQELELCMRYWEQSGSSQGSAGFFSGNVTSGSTYYATVRFRVTKRTSSPSITRTNDSNSNFGATPTNGQPTDDAGFRCERTANGTGAGYYIEHWTADAEL